MVALSHRLDEASLPGPTGESNRLSHWTKPPTLCLGPGRKAVEEQAKAVEALGGRAVRAGGPIVPDDLTHAGGLSGVLWWGDDDTARPIDRALAARQGAIVPLIRTLPDKAHVLDERHVCVDTTASGGNAALLGEVS